MFSLFFHSSILQLHRITLSVFFRIIIDGANDRLKFITEIISNMLQRQSLPHIFTDIQKLTMKGQLKTKLNDKREYSSFPILKCPFLCKNFQQRLHTDYISIDCNDIKHLNVSNSSIQYCSPKEGLDLTVSNVEIYIYFFNFTDTITSCLAVM